ncbi:MULTISPECIES: maleylpyruvate isomerase family mycothiol-dependent enzyme [unclassified Streptomyces]|uniref:maleylpyruvate isomerase family mycothiol-dependent enzyme n=1 Tax=unclassified Streptomyces TaxID=2593676 RepID=UPI001F2283F4|nr:maleylpyruvate isomerase family mycothiol-dependent enzyme [Streptomyces sp. HmicA12]
MTAFERCAAGWEGRDVPLVPGCPGWSVADLVLHLGATHRRVIHIAGADRVEPPEALGDPELLRLPAERSGWPEPGGGPSLGKMPSGLLDWFRDGADRLEKVFTARDPGETAWSWAAGQGESGADSFGGRTVGFWLRLQTIEAAVHRWDAESAAGGVPSPVDTWLAADAVSHAFEVMAPARRAWGQVPGGQGERLRFKQADGFRTWVVQVDPEDVLLNQGSGCCLVELAGSVSDLMLHLWQRVPRTALGVRGDESLLDRYFPSPAPWTSGGAAGYCPDPGGEGAGRR